MALGFPMFVSLFGEDRGAGKLLTGFSAKLDTVGKKLDRVGKKFTAGITVPVAAATFGMFRIGASTEDTMTRIGLLTGATADELDELRASARGVGEDVGRSSSEVARAQKQLVQSGQSLVQTLSTIGPAAHFAVVGENSMEEATGTLIDALAGFNLPASESARLVQLISGSALATSKNIPLLSQALKRGAPVARAFNQDVEGTIATLAVLATVGSPGEQGGTALRQFLVRLSTPSPRGSGVLAELGLSRDDILDSNGEMRDLLGIIRRIEEANPRADQITQLFGEEGGPAMLGLLEKGTQEIDRVLAKARDFDVGSTVATTMEKGTGPTRRFTAAISDLGVTFFDSGFGEGMNAVVRGVTGFVRSLGEAHPRAVRAAGGILLLAATLGPLAIFTSKSLIAVNALRVGIVLASTKLKVFSVLLVTKAIPAAWSFTVALLSNPIGWVAAGIAVAIGLVAVLASKFGLLTKAANLLKAAVPDWLVELFSAGDETPELGGVGSGAGFGPPALPPDLFGGPAAAAPSSETRVRVDFENVPDGVRVSADSDSPDFAMNTGLAMSTF
ncbi:MAG: phage tail tape measure protein [Planctomycetota bacterium]